MPKRADLALQGETATFESVGLRLRDIRIARGSSIREVAKAAGIDKNTVVRIEKGVPASLKVLNRLCVALSTVLPQVTAPVHPHSDVSVFRASTDEWRIVVNTAASRSGLADYAQVSDPQERQRLGDLGFVTGFMQSHKCSITGGTLQAAVMEVHSPFRRPAKHPGEEFLICLVGQVRVRVGDEEHILREGDSVTFRSDLDHNFEPFERDPSAPVAKILMVWIEGARG